MEEDLYIHLIYKRLAGEISEAENGQLAAWLQSAEENQETLDSLTAAWEASEELTPKVKVDLDQEFSFLEQRIKAEEKTTNTTTPIRKLDPPIQKSNRRTWLMAASILFLGISVFLMRDFFGSPKSELVLVQTQDNIKALTLPDGSKVTLNKNSLLTYPDPFQDSERNMELIGEAFFEVTPDKTKPFKIQLTKSEVEVLGTSFNINNRTNEDRVVQVMTGSVQWHLPTMSKVLTSGTTAVSNKITGELSIRKRGKINADYWMHQQLEFDEVEIKYVLLELERLFGIQFSEPASSLINCRFTASFDNPSLDEILETLATVFSIEIIKKNDKQYQLKGGDCQ